MRQPTSVNPCQRFTRSHPCPVCGGYDGAPRGSGVRCAGFLSNDGEWCYCTREQYAGRLELSEKTNPATYVHRMNGECRCGVIHAPARVTPMASKRTMVATYSYLNESSHLAYQTVRWDPKGFSQRRPKVANPNPRDGNDWEWSLNGCQRYLYRLPELLAADPAELVFIFEGEKDVDRAIDQLGVVATTNPMGAGKWREEYNEYLRGRHVVIVPDNDDDGRKHAQQVARSLHGIAGSVRVLELPA
jgi:hypothetical protein